MRPVQVLVVADRLLHDLLVARWSGEPSLTVVVPARADEAWDELAGRRADVVVLDLAVRPSRWERAVELLRERPVGPRVVVLAEPGDDDSACDAARAGVSGWLPYGSSVEDLTETVRLVHDGHGIYPSRLLATVLDGLRHDVAEARRPTGRLSALTEREVEVLRALVEGLSARDIADHLDVAVNTVRTHTHRISGSSACTAGSRRSASPAPRGSPRSRRSRSTRGSPGSRRARPRRGRCGWSGSRRTTWAGSSIPDEFVLARLLLRSDPGPRAES